jgi:hypothetical protein
MPAESGPGVQLEIGHVLFMDVVDYSQLLLDEQRKRQEQVSHIVGNTKQVLAAGSSWETHPPSSRRRDGAELKLYGV